MSAEPDVDYSLHLTKGRPEPRHLKDIRALAAEAEDSDGQPPLSEQTIVDLRTQDDSDRLVVVSAYLRDSAEHDSTELVGVAIATFPVAVTQISGSRNTEDDDAASVPEEHLGTLELVVHPEYRNSGIGTALADKLSAAIPAGAVRAWSHGNHEGATRLAEKHDFEVQRELYRLRLVNSATMPEVSLPEGVTIRGFEPGVDEEAWLAANAAAFAHHPEQGSLTRADLDARMEEDWFDPAGFLMAVDDSGKLLGYHWTKVHPALHSPTTGDHEAVGEVYVVGVVPEAQGSGLGKALTIAGINYLREQGLHAVMLYVDADNTAAVALYRKLGFTKWDVDVMYGPKNHSH